MTRRGRALAAALALLLALLAALVVYDRPPLAPGAWLARAGLAAQRAMAGSRDVRYVRTGAGPAVVLVHGFGSSLYTWKDVMPALAAHHEVVALDLPGFGESERPRDLALEDLPGAVLGLMDRLGIERAALVGNSLGGATVALAAAAQPARVGRLVLIDAAGFNLEPRERPGVVRLATSRVAPLLQALPGKRLIVEWSLRQVLHDDSLVTAERVAEYLAPAQRPGTYAALRSLGRSLRASTPEFEHALAAVRAPTLVVWGDDDRWIPLADADRFVSAIAGARKVVIADCGHLPQEEKPEELARVLIDFLAGGGAGDRG